MKSKIVVLDRQTGTFDYIITCKSGIEGVWEYKYKMKRTKGGDWTEHVKGEKVLSAVDDGNGIRVERNGEEMYFDYSEFDELRLFFSAIGKFDKLLSNSKLVKLKNL